MEPELKFETVGFHPIENLGHVLNFIWLSGCAASWETTFAVTSAADQNAE
jgi:hypothetical protein